MCFLFQSFKIQVIFQHKKGTANKRQIGGLRIRAFKDLSTKPRVIEAASDMIRTIIQNFQMIFQTFFLMSGKKRFEVFAQTN